MNKEIAKKAFDSAKKEVEEKQIRKLKEVIKKTLQRIDEVDKLLKELQEEKKILKLDIDDLKEGRLDRIEERQDKDKKARKTSVVNVEKVREDHHHYHYDRWYQPYVVTWTTPTPHNFPNEVFCLGSSSGAVVSTPDTLTASSSCDSEVTVDYSKINTANTAFTLTNSVASANVAGTYIVFDKTIHLR